MYDRTWARSVYTGYAKLCTRAQQIDLCILQTFENTTGYKPTRSELVELLISSIQAKINPTLWTRYKRLVKRTPLDYELLNDVTKVTIQEYGYVPDQFAFDFEVDVS